MFVVLFLKIYNSMVFKKHGYKFQIYLKAKLKMLKYQDKFKKSKYIFI